MDMGGDNSQIYNDTVKVNCRVVCECIRKEVKKNILDSLKSRRKGRGQEGFAQEMGTIVVEKGRDGDKEFLEQFVET